VARFSSFVQNTRRSPEFVRANGERPVERLHACMKEAFVTGAVPVEGEETADCLFVIGVDVLLRFEFVELPEGPERGVDLD